MMHGIGAHIVPHTILVVDDDPIKRALLRELLTYEGHEIFEAEDGTEALRLTRAYRPDLVILDLVMPDRNGYEYLVDLRADPTIAHTTVISYSALSPFDHQLVLARASGVEYVIRLPAEPEETLRIIRHALAGIPGPIQPQVEKIVGRLETAVAYLKQLPIQKTPP